MRRLLLLCICGSMLLTAPLAIAEVGDPTLETDHPDYPGEGAFQTPEACVRWATRDASTDHARALALYTWLLTHQWHLHSPQEWNLPGNVPGKNPNDTEMMVYDANRGRFSYGYGLCGTVHAWNEVYWTALGMPSRRRAFPGHTNSEVFLDERWRAFDTDMAGLVFNRDGTVAGYDDIRRDPSLVDLKKVPWPRYPFAWPGDFEAMKAGWNEVAKGGHWYSMYAGGYAAHPAIVHLRQGETLTRYFDPDAFGGPEKRRFWHHQAGGPNRLWTFANSGTPYHDGEKSNCRGQTRYGNAVFDYTPDLTREAFREGICDCDQIKASPQGLQGESGKPGFVTFEHFSPYVICGDPADDEDPMQKPATDGCVITGVSEGMIEAEVSGDQGQSWQTLPSQQNQFRWDVTEQVKGRYGWRIKLSLLSNSTIRELRFQTTCQLNQAVYPRLKANGSKVVYRVGGRAVVPVLPNFEQDAATEVYEDRSKRSSNLYFVGRRAGQRAAYSVRGPQPAYAVFRVKSPTQLLGLSAAARFSVRSPSPPGAQFGLSWSDETAVNWHRFGFVALPQDNEFSSGWVSGQATEMPENMKSALVRVELNGGGFPTSLLTAELYGIRQTGLSESVSVTFGWLEEGKEKEHTFVVPAGATKHESQVPTGKGIRDRFVRISKSPVPPTKR